MSKEKEKINEKQDYKKIAEKIYLKHKKLFDSLKDK